MLVPAKRKPESPSSNRRLDGGRIIWAARVASISCCEIIGVASNIGMTAFSEGTGEIPPPRKKGKKTYREMFAIPWAREAPNRECVFQTIQPNSKPANKTKSRSSTEWYPMCKTAKSRPIYTNPNLPSSCIDADCINPRKMNSSRTPVKTIRMNIDMRISQISIVAASGPGRRIQYSTSPRPIPMPPMSNWYGHFFMDHPIRVQPISVILPAMTAATASKAPMTRYQ